MSLTSFLANSDVRERFKQEFPKPKFTLKKEMLAPPVTTSYSLVGTAFDYLFRFYLERLNPGTISQMWVAAAGPFHMNLLRGDPPTKKNQGHAILEKAKVSYERYLQDGLLSDELLRHTILLAHLDVIYRAGMIPDFKVDEGNIDDLRKLISVVDPNLFKAKQVCILNPTFGEGSALVGGADCDLILDSALIDIKTTKKLELARDYLNQVIGYYLLSQIASIEGAPAGHEINTLGIYYSRHALLYTIPVDGIINRKTLKDLIDWFIERAKKTDME